MKSKFLVLLSIVLVGVGAYGLSGFMETNQSEQVTVTTQPFDEPTLVKLWYMKETATIGQIVTRDQLALKRVDESEANYFGFDADVSLEIVPGMIAANDLLEGAYVTQDHFIAPDEDGYVDLTIRDGFVPFPINVKPDEIIGGIISHGSDVDIVAISSTQSNLARSDDVGSDKTLEIRPILNSIPVLQVIEKEVKSGSGTNTKTDTKVSLILELSRKEVATLTIAKKLAFLEVHKSLGEDGIDELNANSGDVLPNYRAVTEFRADYSVIK